MRPTAGLHFQSLAILAARGGGSALRFGAVAWIARARGDEFGVFMVGFTVAGILRILADLGLDACWTREAARAPDPAFLRLVARTKAVLSLVAALAVVAVGVALLGASAVPLLVVLAGGVVLLNGVGLLSAILIVDGRPQTTAVGRGVGGLAALAWVFGWESAGAPLALVAAFEIVAPLLTLAVQLPAATRRFRRPGRSSATAVRTARALVRTALPFSAAGIIVTLHQRVDVLIIEACIGAEAAGIYGAAALVLYALGLLPNAVVGAAFPRLARATVEDAPAATALFRRVLRLLALGSLPIAGAGAVAAGTIVELGYGPGYESAVVPLRLLLLAFPLMAVGEWVGNAAIVAGRERGVVAVLGLGLAVNVVGNVVLIPEYGLGAAAATTVTTEAVILAGLPWLLRRPRRDRP